MIAGSDRLDISSCSSMRPIAGFDPARRLQLVRNPNHDQATDRLRANLVDGIQVVVKPSVASILQDVEAGRLDGSLADEPFERAMRNYLSDPTKFRHLHGDSANKTMFRSMNLTRPPFDDVHVRRAVNYALDKVAIQRAWGGPSFGQIARHILPPTLLHGRLVGYDPYRSAAGEDSGDLARAKAEMRRSRYDRDHDGLCDAPACRRLTLLNRDQRPWTAVEPIAVARLARIGIIVTPRRLPILAYMATVTTPKKAIPIVIAPLWSADYLDPYNFVSAVFSGTSILPDSNVNVSLVGLTRTMAANLGVAWPQGRVPSVDADIDQCQGIPATTPDPRDRCWEKLERRLMEQVVPWVPLLWLNQLTISSQGMVSYDFNQFATQTSFTEVAVANRIDAATLD